MTDFYDIEKVFNNLNKDKNFILFKIKKDILHNIIQNYLYLKIKNNINSVWLI